MFPHFKSSTPHTRRISQTLAFCLAVFFSVLPALAQSRLLDPMDAKALETFEAVEAVEALDHDTSSELEQPAHYVVVQTIDDDPLYVTHYQKVVMNGPLPSQDDAEIAARSQAISGRQSTTAIVRLRDDITGEVVWQDVVKIPRWLRSEVSLPAGDPRIAAREGSNIEGVVMPATEVTFAVRAPIVEGATTLEVTHGEKSLRSTESIDLVALERQFSGTVATKAIAGAFHEGVPGHFGGPSSNRLDVLFVAEGYSASSDRWFRTDTDILTDRFLGETPWDRYAPLMNFHRLFVPSAQNGADRPACSDSEGDGLDNDVFVDTAFDATFCSSDTWRLLTVDNAKVLAAAGQYPNWDQIVVVVQTPYRGGSGGSFATTSLGPNYVIDDDITGVMVHEFAHSYADLADEYTTPFPGYPMCSDTNSTTSDDCEANVTNVTSRSAVKWNRWIASTTAVPTLLELADPTAAGLWEGARYQDNGFYRQCFDGKMRNTLSDFCDVDSEALILKLYDGGWGSPSAGVNLIEPGTRSPSSTWVSVGDFESVTLKARVIGPNGSNVKVQWYVGGVLKSTQWAAPFSTPSYTHRAGPAGSLQTIQMRVQEASPILHSSQQSRSLSTTTWYVDVQGCQFC